MNESAYLMQLTEQQLHLSESVENLTFLLFGFTVLIFILTLIQVLSKDARFKDNIVLSPFIVHTVFIALVILGLYFLYLGLKRTSLEVIVITVLLFAIGHIVWYVVEKHGKKKT